MNYKGYVIEEETNPWALKHGFKFQYLKGPETIYGAKSLKEAAAQIDELTCNDPSPEDKLKIAVQCIEACGEEFKYRHTDETLCNYTRTPAVTKSYIDLCANALKAIQE